MGRLTVDIPDAQHHHLRLTALHLGVSLRDIVLTHLKPAFVGMDDDREQFRKAMDAWMEKRKQFTLDRGDKSLREIIHDGHKW